MENLIYPQVSHQKAGCGVFNGDISIYNTKHSRSHKMVRGLKDNKLKKKAFPFLNSVQLVVRILVGVLYMKFLYINSLV